MRDWLKNVLITLYERDEDNNLLTEKQKLKVGDRGWAGSSPSQWRPAPIQNDLWHPCEDPPKVSPCTPFPC